MNIQFGSSASAPQIAPSTGNEGRGSVSAPTGSENQNTTSFVPLKQNDELSKPNDKDPRQATDSRREEQQARVQAKIDERRQKDQSEQDNARTQQQENRNRSADRGDEEARQLDQRLEENRRADEATNESQSQERVQQQRRLEEELKVIRQLAERDREVRAHEQAHQAVGGQYAGGMSLSYERGPDGKRYAVEGEVSIDVGKVPDDPQATLDKAETVRRAALAPAEPSAQDRRVAAQAIQIAVEARSDILQERQASLTENADAQDAESSENSDVNNEQQEQRAKQESEVERQDERKAQQDKQLEESNRVNEAAANLQELNERLARIQAQLVEVSQLDDRVKARENLLDITT